MGNRPQGQRNPADVMGKAIRNARSATRKKQETTLEQPTKGSLARAKARGEITPTDERSESVSEDASAV